MGIPVKGAGVGIRALATIIDGIILGVIGGIIAAVLGTGLSGGHLGGSYYFWLLVAGFCYYTYFESSRGATPGKLLCGLKVIKVDGTDCDIRTAAMRTVCRIIDGLIAYLVAAIFVWSTDLNQRLGDKLADTLVIKIK
ncbi:RDD family protein [Sporomusa acidovorans]|uniref:RDD domain-containing protein n=1 Tax=Sporomusa acidovorans (strain ATCC 49682 / DSM 3132 / Mol) TaxID=1123286 RepID=A0ABZ3J0F8_SPOA4|nr:RDD family protein [Sporomusa acidovorans]OZC21344.1 RDD family protein [Sporomusa acidovorans DSM 3132]SDE56783.1 Uncharacterized membrane protein YckC, RDD family [Sporomusa acidovorans]